MDGVRLPRCVVCGMAVVCAAVLPGAVMWLVPYSSHCSAGEYCCHVVHCSLPGVWCVGSEYLPVVFVWWGILCLLPPRRGGGWGHCGWWGGMTDGGWHDDRRAAVSLASPSLCWCPPSCSLGGLVEGRWCVVSWCPCLGVGPLCSLSQHCWFRVVSL